MKKKTLCAFSLILWFLLFSTFFSLWVERITVPWVTVTTGAYKKDSFKPFLPLDCLAQDEEGNPVLYQTFEGTGWEEGIRAILAAPQSYTILPDKIELEYSGGSFIRYFSKPPQIGKLVNIIPKPQEGPDTLLVLSPEGLPPVREELLKGYQIVDRTENALLVSAERSSFPFLPKEADSRLFETDPFDVPERQVYSLAEVRSFAGSIRILALIPGFGLMVFLLWLYSCFLVKNPKRNRGALLANGILAIAALLSIPWILNAAELPSSLLPRGNISDFSHYTAEFSEILSALEGFANTGNQIAEAALQSANQSFLCALAVLLGSVLLAAALIVLEAVFLKRRTSPKGRHARHAER